MPSRRHSSAIFSSPRRPSKTIRTFSSAEYFLRVRRRISRTVASTPAVVSSLIVYSLVSSILTRKSHLSFLPYCVSQVLTRNIQLQTTHCLLVHDKPLLRKVETTPHIFRLLDFRSSFFCAVRMAEMSQLMKRIFQATASIN